MANTYTRGTAKDYPQSHNNREKKLMETVFATAPTYGVKECAASAADYAITNTDGYNCFIVNDAITITLPDASENTGRRILFIQKAGAVLTVAQNTDGANIAGADANYTSLDAAGDRAELVSSGTEWLVVSSTIAP
jgi:hypothetical protein